MKVLYNITAGKASVPAPLIAQRVTVTAPAISRAFVIVDSGRLKGVSLGQCAEYVAMVGLADLKPSLHGDSQSILTLFDGQTHLAPSGMTDWDRALLKSLYAEPAGQQRDELAAGMVHQIVPDPVEDIVITADREKLSKLKREIEKSGDAFFDAYNTVNTDPEYSVSCLVDYPWARWRVHTCTPQFVLDARWDGVGRRALAARALKADARVVLKYADYRKHLLEVVEKNPKLIKLLEDYNMLTKHYQTVLDEKLKGKWIVFD